MRLPFLHPGPPSGDDHDGLSGGPCASTRLLVGGILWFCLCLGLSLWLASREGGAVLVAEDGQPVLATGDWLRHRDRLDDLMRQTLSRVMPGCRLLTMPGFSEQEARHYRVEGDGAPLRLALALQERLCQEALRTGPDGERLLADDAPMPQLRWTDDGVLEADVDGRTCLVLHFPGWETMLATLSRPMPEPALVLVIDDMGQKLEPAEQLASLPFPVALALWPHAAARRPELGDVGHPRAYRGDALGADLVRVHMQGLHQLAKIQRYQQGAVMQDASLPQGLRAARDLAAPGFQIVASGKGGLHAELGQRRADRTQVTREVHGLAPVRILHEGKIEVAQIMIDRAAAGHAAHHGQAAPADEVSVDLVQRDLMASHDDAGGVLPEQKQARMIRGQPLQQAFFKSEIESRIGGRKGKKLHGTLLKRQPTGAGSGIKIA